MLNTCKVISRKIINSIRQVKIQIFKNDILNANQLNQPGIDSNPIDNDKGVIINVNESRGKSVLLGIYNKNDSVDPGEIKIYSRDSNGNIVSFIHVKEDGTIEIDSNGANVEINGNTKRLTLWDELAPVLDSIVSKINTHTHTGVTTGAGVSGPLSPPSLVIDTAPLKTDTIRTDG